MQILIAGHGYLGQPLAEHLAAAGHEVVALTKHEPSESDHRTYPVHSCDVSNRQEIADLNTSPDAIVHCASSNRGGPDAYRAVFRDGIRNLSSHFSGIPVFLTSSTSVYPQTDGSVVTEESASKPDRETGQILREAEDMLLGNGGTVLRLAGIYGPNRSVYLKRFLEGSATIESGEVSRFLNQIHVEDAISAIHHLLDRPALAKSQIYNVTDGNPITQRACFEWLAEHFDKPVPPESPADMNRKRAWTNKQISNEKLKSAGWKPEYPDFFEAVKHDPELVLSLREVSSESD
ncbi:MAG: NAD-dependent epimerase/dehydratase family protein [Verrucomicrobiales bacterium]|nr:NAD-dependent epimerase/dehydratase family protein [Verrucomicrobiales bacterium]